MKKIMITSALALGVVGAFLPAANAGPFNSDSVANVSGSQSTEVRYDHHRRYHRERITVVMAVISIATITDSI